MEKLASYSTWKSALGMYKEEDVEKAAQLLDMLGLSDRFVYQMFGFIWRTETACGNRKSAFTRSKSSAL